MKNKISMLFVALIVIQLLFSVQSVSAATYNFCGKALVTTFEGRSQILLLHCSSTYAVVFIGPYGGSINGRWVEIQGGPINFFYPYKSYTYNNIRYTVVGEMGHDATVYIGSSCLSCKAFYPPVQATATKTNTYKAPTSTFPWYTNTPAYVTSTKYPTITPTPTQSKTRTATPTTTLEVDPQVAQKWVDLKRGIIPALSIPSVKTGLIDIPLTTRINETGASMLLDEIQSKINTKSLSAKQYDALVRLVIQEQAYQALLPVYADAVSQFTKPLADLAKLLIGYNRAFDSVFGVVPRGKLGFEDYIYSRMYDTEIKLEREVMVDALKLIQIQGLPKDTLSKVADVTSRISRGLTTDKGYSLKQLLSDTLIEAAIGKIYLELYVNQVQQQIDKGVATVRAAPNEGPFRMTGNAERANLMLRDIIQKAQWADESAQQRTRDFSRAAKYAEYYDDIANLASKTVFPPALAFSVLGKISRLTVNTISLAGTLEDMVCIKYLSERAGEIAFNSQVSGEDCKYKYSTNPNQPGIKLASSVQNIQQNPLSAPFQQQSESYRALLNELVSAARSGTPQQIGDAVRRFGSAEEGLSGVIKQNNARGLASENPGEILIDLVNTSKSLSFTNMAIYISAMDNAVARVDGKSPETDLADAARTALGQLDEYTQVLIHTNLMPDQPAPMVNISDIRIAVENNKASIYGQVQNYGTDIARGVRVDIVDSFLNVNTFPLSDIQPGKTIMFSGTVPFSGGKETYEAVLSLAGEWFDSRSLFVNPTAVPTPLPSTKTPTISTPSMVTIAPPTIVPPTPNMQVTVIPAKPTGQNSVNNTTLIIVGIFVGATIVFFIVWYFLTKKSEEDRIEENHDQ